MPHHAISVSTTTPLQGWSKHQSADPNPDLQVFAPGEVDALVKEAQVAKAPVSCDAGTIERARIAVEAGVDAFEHAYFADRAHDE